MIFVKTRYAFIVWLPNLPKPAELLEEIHKKAQKKTQKFLNEFGGSVFVPLQEEAKRNLLQYHFGQVVQQIFNIAI